MPEQDSNGTKLDAIAALLSGLLVYTIQNAEGITTAEAEQRAGALIWNLTKEGDEDQLIEERPNG